MPIAVFAVFAVVMQAANVLSCIAIETYLSKAASVTAFALFYLGAFWIAWRLTVWVVDARWRSVRVADKPGVGVLLTVAQLPVWV